MENHDDLLAAARRLEQYAAAHMTGPQLADVRMVADAARRRGQAPPPAHRAVGLAVLDGGASAEGRAAGAAKEATTPGTA